MIFSEFFQGFAFFQTSNKNTSVLLPNFTCAKTRKEDPMIADVLNSPK